MILIIYGKEGAFVNNKYSNEFKLQVVNYYLENDDKGYVSTARHFNLPSEVTVLHWVRRYKEKGEQGFVRNSTQAYDEEFKKNVVEYMHKNDLSYLETAIHFNLGSNNVVSAWEEKYIKEGPDGLARRKKYSKNSRRKKDKKSKKELKYKTKKELIEEIEKLREENEYIRKVRLNTKKKMKTIF